MDRPHPFLQKASGQIIKDDVKSFPPPQIFSSNAQSNQKIDFRNDKENLQTGCSKMSRLCFLCRNRMMMMTTTVRTTTAATTLNVIELILKT